MERILQSSEGCSFWCHPTNNEALCTLGRSGVSSFQRECGGLEGRHCQTRGCVGPEEREIVRKCQRYLSMGARITNWRRLGSNERQEPCFCPDAAKRVLDYRWYERSLLCRVKQFQEGNPPVIGAVYCRSGRSPLPKCLRAHELGSPSPSYGLESLPQYDWCPILSGYPREKRGFILIHYVW